MSRVVNIDDYGRVLVRSDDLTELLYAGYDPSDLSILSDEKIETYNHWCKVFNKQDYQIIPATTPAHTPQEEHARRTATWFIPEEFQNLNVRASLLERCERDDERVRINLEMDLYEARDLLPLLKLMFAMVDHFRRHNIVWGVGRGSSCASYVLYLIGVHKIDSLFYDLDIAEFLKD